MKKLMLGALAALCAILALPAFASATAAHLDQVPEGGFTVHGNASGLTRVAGGGTTGTTTTGTGSFENTTTGTVSLTFDHATSTISTNCTSAGETTGAVKTETLPFHLVMIETNKPGILITPNANGYFAHFSCGIFIPTVEVKGNGILGTITSPACGGKSTTATLSFGSNGAGVQNHTSWTGNTYSLESSIGGGAYSQSAMEAHATITFAGSRELICTH